MDQSTSVVAGAAAASGGVSSGSLRTKISLRGLSFVGSSPSSSSQNMSPFYLMKSELPAPSTLLGSVNLLSYYGMDSAYNKFCGPKKLREELSAFLPHLPGNIDSAAAHDDTNMSSLKKLITRQTICSELAPLSANALAGFRLNPGPVAEPFRYFGISSSNANANSASTNSNNGAVGDDRKSRKRKHRRSFDDTDRDEAESDRKFRKQKKDEDREKKRKRKEKKEKKKKRASPQL